MSGLTSRLAFLRRHGVDTPGSQRPGVGGTRALLEAWSVDGWLCDAGLFHSVYGTESFRQVSIPLDLCGRVREGIGAQAERLAYVFGAMTHKSFSANPGLSEGVILSSRSEPLRQISAPSESRAYSSYPP